MDIFDPALLRNIETMNLQDAHALCEELIQKSKTRANRKFALLRDIKAAPSPKELSRIMWNVFLAGEGMPITDSAWQKTYGK